ncbi:primosomal protein DnaI [Shouchella shacheensis]|uniref:primosomal protein DnaI n=1 Tax=Shouchella shacheensis TaxID=1649580 RepID=UPI00074052AD|nr:primosomal protein DnaI [Shouchella shacheensis]
MDSIQSALEGWDKSGKLEERLEKQRQKLLADPYIKDFLEGRADVTRSMIDLGMMKLYEFKKERTHCDHCPGLENCPNMMQGFRPVLHVERQQLEIAYSKCPLKLKQEEDDRQKMLIQSLHMPKDILNASFDDIDREKQRQPAIMAAMQFAAQANPGESGQGLYLCGKFGVGKTYLIGAIANHLKGKGIQTYLVYTPDFFREMKQSIADNSYQEKIEVLRVAEVLILDDIGAETTTAWTRDEILGPILQYRMQEKLPTLFTSNYDYETLEKHLMYSTKGGEEELKAMRIMERIKHFTTFVEVNGRNRRV